MKRPTLEELSLHAAKIGLPEREAQKFFCFYESKGWRVGKSPMKNWRIAMGGWKLRWEESRMPQYAVSATAQAIIAQTELKNVEETMRAISSSYSEHQHWSEMDGLRFRKLKARKAELKQLLGMQV